MYFHFVYALYSLKYNKSYIGKSQNIKVRLKSHYYFATKGYTTKYRPWKLVYLEKCKSKTEALKREKALKSAKGREFIWKIIHKKY